MANSVLRLEQQGPWSPPNRVADDKPATPPAGFVPVPELKIFYGCGIVRADTLVPT
ncbi:hypothetical protein ACFQ1S_04525 [Kibdelosporangium lantanae]|uniref:Uncharacterized protein n=1 Tax=Kibdelosporangium lantanae TaxID=1497396 RepID=A0ABW3M2Q4_9PSEU